jgi:hypothetical protein
MRRIITAIVVAGVAACAGNTGSNVSMDLAAQQFVAQRSQQCEPTGFNVNGLDPGTNRTLCSCVVAGLSHSLDQQQISTFDAVFPTLRTHSDVATPRYLIEKMARAFEGCGGTLRSDVVAEVMNANQSVRNATLPPMPASHELSVAQIFSGFVYDMAHDGKPSSSKNENDWLVDCRHGEATERMMRLQCLGRGGTATTVQQ